MARLAVNPTRMELRRLKARLKTAERGHKLLKDKSDEMVRQFLIYIKRNKLLREELEPQIVSALMGFTIASAVAGRQEIEQALLMPGFSVNVVMEQASVMGVDVPSIKIEKTGGKITLPYALASTPGELDEAVLKLSGLSRKLLELAETEKTCNMLAAEIEKNRRRVNALEFVMIPQLEETIKYILMKMDENERGGLIRLMKVKSMIEKRGR